MADVEAAIYARLSGYSDLTDLVSTRIFAGLADQGAATPHIVFNDIYTSPNSAMGGDITPTETLIQVTVTAADGATCKSVANEVKNALRRYSGTSGGVVVQSIFFEDEFSKVNPNTREFERFVDFRVFFEE